MADDCIFCGIVEKRIPAKVAYEDDQVLAFYDIHPKAPAHLQVIPKQHIPRVSDLSEGNAHVVSKLVLTANRLARELGVAEPGYRLVINCNPGAGQTVYHLHLHLLGGRPFSWPPG